MKKHFILLSTFVAWMLSATLLTACGEDVQESADNGNNSETVTETTVGENCTLFSTGDEGTRTALGYDRKFYWSGGDQIYVNIEGSQYDPSLIKEDGDEYSEVVFTKQWAELRLAESSANLATDYSGVEVELVEVPANSGNLSFRAYASLTDDNARANYHNVTSLTNTLSFSAVTQDPIRRVSIVWRTEGTASLKIRHVYLIKKDGMKEEVTPTSRNACTITPVSIPGSSGSTGPQYARTSKSTLSSDKRTADFVLEGVSLTAPKCSVVYIGNGTTAATPKASALKVKIEATQTQAAWGDTAHIGRAGDCGVAVATKDGGKYTFKLTHKASYLVFQPYKAAQITANWKLIKIEIIANGTTLAGTYDFGTGELVGTGSSNTVEVNCNSTIAANGVATGGFDLNHTAASEAKSCFAVIAPGDHKLTIRYTVQPEVSVNNVAGATFTIDKEIPAVNADGSRTYGPNVVTTIKHKLDVMLFAQYYQWGAADTYPNTWQADAYNYTYMNTDLANPFWSQVPNANEAGWYVVRGDPHWDTIDTTLSTDGGVNVYTRISGLWLLKRNNIAGFNASTDPFGINLLTFTTSYSSASPTQGKPANDTNYFFLPMLGRCQQFSQYEIGWRGYYWLRSPYGSHNGQSAYYLDISDRGGATLGTYNRAHGFIAGPGWFQ